MMTLMFPLLDKPIQFEENRIQELIIENPIALRQFVEELKTQIDGQTGEIVLAVNYAPRELSSDAALLIDPFNLEMETKKIVGKLQQAVLLAAEEHEDKSRQLISEINSLAAELCLELDFSASFEPIEEIKSLISVLRFRFDSENLSFPELLLEWMQIQRQFLGRKLIIIYGLKAWMSREEIVEFYHSVFYEKFHVLLLEPSQKYESVEGECLTIIDEDLCVIT